MTYDAKFNFSVFLQISEDIKNNNNNLNDREK